MAPIVAPAASTSQRESLASVRGTSAKAALKPQVSTSELPDVAGRAIRKAHGKMLTAASVLGVSESQIGRLVNDGDLKLKQLDALGPATLAALGKELVETYGTMSTPQARAQQNIRSIRRLLDEVEELIA